MIFFSPEKDNDPNGLGLLDPNAPDEMSDNKQSLNEAPPDDECPDGEPARHALREWDFPHTSKPKVTCGVFEDNVGALELTNAHKLCPKAKHLSVQPHHFRQCAWIRK